MDATSYQEVRSIAGWNDDLKNLKRLRHIRNNLVHDPEYEPDYDAEDIEYLKSFYQRIMDQKDPLSLLKAMKASSNKQLKLDLADSISGRRQGRKDRLPGVLIALVIVCVVVIGVVAAIMLGSLLKF